MAKIVYKIACPSVANYQSQKMKQNAVDYRNHLTIENNLKVEKKVYYFENKHNFPFSHKTLGVCVEANTPKNSKAIMHFARKLFIAS